MHSDSIQDANRYIVDVLHEGPILPSAQQEIRRRVFLKRGAHVRGGVLCGDFTMEGGARVEQSVHACGEVSVACGNGVAELGACLSSARSVLAAADEGAAAAEGAGYLRVGADLCAPTINVTRAVVYGNVYGDRVVLRDCVVLGAVHARTQLTMRDCLVATFTAGRLELRGPVRLFLPLACVDVPMDLAHSVSCFAFEDVAAVIRAEVPPSDGYRFTSDDVRVMYYQDPRARTRRGYHVLSLAPRVVDLRAVGARMRRNYETLGMLAMRDLRHPNERTPLAISPQTLDRRLLAWALAPQPAAYTAAPGTGLSRATDVAGGPAVRPAC